MGNSRSPPNNKKNRQSMKQSGGICNTLSRQDYCITNPLLPTSQNPVIFLVFRTSMALYCPEAP